jgi:hypothetical protein
MTSWHETIITAIAVTALTVLPALAQVVGGGNGPDAPPGGVGVPGPLAGAGLPFLLFAGGYALIRRYRNRSSSR